VVLQPSAPAENAVAIVIEYPASLVDLRLIGMFQSFARDAGERALQVPKLLGIRQVQVMTFPMSLKPG
jgi:hypothetical protein